MTNWRAIVAHRCPEYNNSTIDYTAHKLTLLFNNLQDFECKSKTEDWARYIFEDNLFYNVQRCLAAFTQRQ